jgi:hypothetical protein
MNADDARRKDLAELARLLPDPAGSELPAGRQHALKEHLMTEVRMARRAPAGLPATHRRRKPAIAVAVAAAAASAIALILLPGSTPGASPAAVRLLARIATAAAAQPSAPVRSSQFWYIESWVANQVCQGGSGSDCTTEKPYETQLWQSVSNLCVTGLLREDGQDIPLPYSWTVNTQGGLGEMVNSKAPPGHAATGHGCPQVGGVHDPTYRFLQSLPTDPQALLSLIEQEMQGQLPRPEEAFTTIGDLLGTAITPPQVSAALYRAAALIPGVTVVADATDAIGRHGVAVAFTYLGTRTEWIFSKQTLQYLGSRSINVANGSTTGEAAVLQRAFVDHAGQLPG